MSNPRQGGQQQSAPRQGGWGSRPAAANAQLDVERMRRNTLATPSRPPPSDQHHPQRNTVGAAESAAATSTPGGGAFWIAPQPFDAYIVLDLEATCEAGRRITDAEVIEFPMVLVDPRTATQVAEFQRYVRPVKNPMLSRFCTELTGITQNMVSHRDPFPVVYCEALQFLAEAGLGDAPPLRSYCVVTCGDWDLKTMLPSQIRISGQQGTPLSFQRWCNLKKYMSGLGLRDGGERGGPTDMPDMLRILGLPHQGRHHSGIDDCRNIAAVLCALLKRGLVVDTTFATEPFERWHAPAEAQLPALQELRSTLADGAIQHSRDLPPPLSHARTEDNAPQGEKQQQQQQQPPMQARKGRSASQPAFSANLILPALGIDTNRDAVQELLSDTNAATAATSSRVFDKEELKTTSKFMSALLRHKAVQWRVPITSNGYVLLDDVLRQPQMRRKPQVSVQDVARMVRDSDKQRFQLAYGAADGRLYITATQGHSIDGVEPKLRTLTSVEEVPMAIHGTYWEAWKTIQRCGYLSAMTRQHIHFAKGLMNDAQVISGMRNNVQLFIYLDVAAVLADGVALYESTNGVILTPGVGDTRQLPLKYVAKVVDRSSGCIIYPV